MGARFLRTMTFGNRVITGAGTFPAGADESGQFHRWTFRQNVGLNCLKTSPPVLHSEPTWPGKLSGPYTDLSSAFEIVPGARDLGRCPDVPSGTLPRGKGRDGFGGPGGSRGGYCPGGPARAGEQRSGGPQLAWGERSSGGPGVLAGGATLRGAATSGEQRSWTRKGSLGDAGRLLAGRAARFRRASALPRSGNERARLGVGARSESPKCASTGEFRAS